MEIIFIIQKVQDTVIHLEVDEEEQWEITQGSKGCWRAHVLDNMHAWL